jgi:hypothetical protein
MKLLSIVSAAGLAATVAATGKDIVYTTITVPVYTTYCPVSQTETSSAHPIQWAIQTIHAAGH